MLPFGSSMLVTRLPLLGSSRAELVGMIDQLEGASKLLADAKVDVIVFHCTACLTVSLRPIWPTAFGKGSNGPRE